MTKEFIIEIMPYLLSGAGGAFIIWFLQSLMEWRRRRYERRLYIFRTLLANSVNVVSFDFVSAFNMILIEYGAKTQVRYWHNKFIEHVNLTPTKKKDELTTRNKNFNNILIKLIEELAKSIHIPIEQMDISGKVYWPKGFGDAADKQQKLTDLLISNQEQWNGLLNAMQNSERAILIQAKKTKTKKVVKKRK